MANVTAGEYPRVNGKLHWRHSGEIWARMWEEVAREFEGCEVESPCCGGLRSSFKHDIKWGGHDFERWNFFYTQARLPIWSGFCLRTLNQLPMSSFVNPGLATGHHVTIHSDTLIGSSTHRQ